MLRACLIRKAEKSFAKAVIALPSCAELHDEFSLLQFLRGRLIRLWKVTLACISDTDTHLSLLFRPRLLLPARLIFVVVSIHILHDQQKFIGQRPETHLQLGHTYLHRVWCNLGEKSLNWVLFTAKVILGMSIDRLQ